MDRIRVGIIVMALLSGFSWAPGPAQAPGALTVSVQAGFDGYCRYNRWTPVQVFIENNGPGLAGQVEVSLSGFSQSPDRYAQAVELPRNSHQQVSVPVFLTTNISRLETRLLTAGGVAARQLSDLNCLEPGDRLVGLWAGLDWPQSVLAGLEPPAGRVAVARLSAATLPDQAALLDALDLIVIAGADTSGLSPAQRAALQDWVVSGGQALVTGGSDWQAVSAGLADLLPAQLTGSQGLTTLQDFSADLSGSVPLEGDMVVSVGSLAPGAQALLAHGETLLAARRPLGGGEILYLAFDPSLEPFKSWRDRDRFLNKMLSGRPEAPAWGRGFQAWEPAADAAAVIPDLRLPGSGIVVSFLCLYGLLVGPVNYFLLRRLGRREWAWLTVPALALLFSLAAFAAGSSARGSQPEANLLALVQVWPGSGRARLDGILSIYSPQRASFDLELPAGPLAHPLPDVMRLARAGGWRVEITASGDITFPDLRMDAGSLSAFAVESALPCPALGQQLHLEQRLGVAILRGAIQAPDGLDLEGAALVFPGGSQLLGDLAAGESRDLEIWITLPGQAQPSANPSGTVLAIPSTVPGSAYQADLSERILGPATVLKDPERRRRAALIEAFATTNPFSAGGPAQGLFLAAWGRRLDQDLRLSGSSALAQEDTVLYIFYLDPEVSARPDGYALTPGFFSWRSLEPDSSGLRSPYNLSLPQDRWAFEFNPALPLPPGPVAGLTFHLQSYSATGPTGFSLSAWDQDRQEWVALSAQSWGDFTVPEPQRFVSRSGAVRFQLENLEAYQPVAVQAVDFTLVIGP